MTAAELTTFLTHLDGSGPGLLGMVVALLWQISASARRGFGAVQRLGRRIGRLEQDRAAALLRLAVLEDLLRDEGLSVPRFPGPAADTDDDDDSDDAATVAHRVSVPAVPPLPDTLRRSARR
jgi:hypothetical protein